MTFSLSLFAPFSSQQLLRRSSDGVLGTYDHPSMRNFDPNTLHATSSAAALLATRRAQSSMSGRMGMMGTTARSWHPSPFHSDDESGSLGDTEPQFYKDEKKNRIKMEIARRRQQIEENACLHEELTRLAKLRESAELGGVGVGVNTASALNVPSSLNPHGLSTTTRGLIGGGAVNNAAAALNNHHSYSGVSGLVNSLDGLTTTTTAAIGGNPAAAVGGGIGNSASVLKSVDDILNLRTRSALGATGAATTTTSALASDPLLQSTVMTGLPSTTSATAGFNSDLYTSSVYNRVSDFSPITNVTDLNDAARRTSNSVSAAAGVNSLLVDGTASAATDPMSSYLSAGKYTSKAYK